MSDFNRDNTLPRDIVDEMKESYLNYSMSVIVSRALPDVRDGLKPVHRRILYGMSELGSSWNRPYKKSARIVGIVFESVNVDGGMVENNLLMQFQSDIFDKKVVSQEINEITALGVGAASFLHMNKMPFENMKDFITQSETWNPNIDSKS